MTRKWPLDILEYIKLDDPTHTANDDLQLLSELKARAILELRLQPDPDRRVTESPTDCKNWRIREYPEILEDSVSASYVHLRRLHEFITCLPFPSYGNRRLVRRI
jgi:hypothetical protein